MKKTTIKDILSLLNQPFSLYNINDEHEITGINNIQNAGKNELAWIKSSSTLSASSLASLSAGLIVAPFTLEEEIKNNHLKNSFLFVEDSKYIFSYIANRLFSKEDQSIVYAGSTIHPEAAIGTNCEIGPNCYIGKSSLGNQVRIIGNVYIFDNVKIGNNVTIQPGVVIGSAGFGYAKDKNNNIEAFPHIGGVEIGDNVEIGANTCIDRGALGSTIIEDNVKIDNLVHIAHNVVVGKNSFVIANAMLGGSVTVGENCWISPSVSVLQQLRIEANSLIGVGSVVTKNIPAGQTWTGVPAKPLEEFIALQKALKEMMKK